MKKIFILLAALLLINGAVWAQSVPASDLTAPIDSFAGEMFDTFGAVPTLSTESRYSAGIFSSYVDDFIDVNFFNPKAGTFFFLGGYPSGASVNVTDEVTGADADPDTDPGDDAGFPYTLSAGFARTTGFGYMGVYYGGSLVDSAGYSDKQNNAEKGKYTQWENNLAVLLAFNALPGAIRFDFAQNTTVQKDSLGSNTNYLDRQLAPSLALTYGLAVQNWHPYITVGYKFADKEVESAYDGNDKYYQQTTIRDSVFGIQAGTWYDLDETSSVSGAVVFRKNGASSTTGDIYTTLFGYDDYFGENKTSIDIFSGGDWGIAFKAAYAKTFEFGKISFGFKPNMTFGFMANSKSAKDIDGTFEEAAKNHFQINTGVDLGLKYQHNEKFGFYTGASLQVIDYNTWYYSGGKNYGDGADSRGDTRQTGSAYDIEGLKWDTSVWNNVESRLGFGMTFSPMQNLVIGAGLNTVLDRLFYIDLEGMRVGTGTWFTPSAGDGTGGKEGAQNALAEALKFFDGIQFDLTVSYQF